MKKVVVLLLMALLGTKAQAQLLQGDAFKANKGYEIGLIGGVLGVYDDLSYGAFGLNFRRVRMSKSMKTKRLP